MGRFNCFINGALLGAGALYFFDPQLGRRRRALLEDQFRRIGRQASEGLDAALRDLSNRAHGTCAELQHLVSAEQVSDDVLCQRIRSLAGRYLSNASALKVDVSEGCVCLSGPVFAQEAGPLVHAVRAARGVRHVENDLELHESPGNIPSMQGIRRRSGELPELLQANWAPGTRLVAGAAGSLMMLNCMVSRSLGSKLLGVLGFALTSRAMANPLTTTSQLRMRTGMREHDDGQQRSPAKSPEGWQAGPPAPWPTSSSAVAPASGTGGTASGGRVSSGSEDRPDVWPPSRATPAQQTGMAGPLADQ
jgi:hypothetical protein